MSIRVLHCHITWRYWLWRTREGEEIQYDHTVGEEPKKSSSNRSDAELPCRVHAFFEGVEWFIYNRTPSYNVIIEKIGVPDVLAPPDVEGTTEETPHPVLATTYPPTPSSSSQKSVVDENQGIWNKLRTAVWRVRMPEIDFNEILPVGLEFRKGALVVGNDSTPSILIMDIAGGTGSYGVSQSRSKYDEYKQMYDIQLGQVKLITRTNPDYRKRMVDRGNEVVEHIGDSSNNLPPGSLSFETFHQIIHRLSLPFSAPATPYLSGAAPFPKKWGGLARYHHTNNDSSEKTGILHEPEYAKVTCLLETPALNIIYYGDVAGKVPHHAKTMPTEPVDIGNGDEAPEWGIEVELHGGPSTITYGPWADRQRVHWQQMLAPSTYQNTQPTPKLKTGDLRQSVSLRVSIRFRDEVKLRIPTREPSKASSLLGDLDIQRRRHRRYGWLDLRIEAESFIKYTLPMVASCDGYTAILEANLKTVAASSSVNQVEFLRADRCTIRATMPTPHKWNAERKWDVQVGLVKPSIKLLRDHINLVSDIVKDWTSIPLPPNSMEDVKRLATEEYNRFVPITYSLGVALESYRLDLYANDHNIVDWPLSHVDNSFLTLTGHNLSTNVLILSNEFRPEFSATPFEVIAPNLDLTLSMPKWNTHSAFSTPRTSNIGHVKSLSVSGSYTSYADIRADAVDRLRMDIEAKNILFKAFGWAIRHLMVVKENYFGMFTNFTMRNEFFTKLHSQNLGDPVREKYREGQTNPFEIDMGLVVSDSLLVLPQEVFDCQGATLVRLPELQVILRSHEHAMEMSLNVAPFLLSVTETAPVTFNHEDNQTNPKDCLKVEGIDITANRLFGPQPEVATYLCIWEILPGEISGRLSVSSLVGILASARAFRINFADDFNSPSSDFAPPPLPDITFLRVTCPLIDVTIGLGTTIDHILPRPQEAYEDSLLHFSISKGFSIRLTDRPHPSYASCMRFDLPNISFRILQRVTGFHQTWFELASISADISGEQASAPLGWKEHTQEQLNFLRMQDATTHRVGFLYGSNLPVSEVPRHGGLTYLTPLKVPFGFGEHKIRPNSTAESGFEGKEYADSFRSEQDEVMTEASRDARVAKSRPVTPQVVIGKSGLMFKGRNPTLDGEISSGDESDNDPSEYEPSMTSSVVAFGEDEISVQSPQWPFVDHYRQALRRALILNSKQDPTRSFRDPAEDTSYVYLQQARKDAQDNEDTSSLKITVQHGLNVMVTPTCIPFTCQLITEFNTRSSTLDLLVDSILDDFLDIPVSNHNGTANRLSVEIDIPLTRIMFLQSLMSSTEADALSTGVRRHTALPIHVDARVLALFDIEVQQAACRLETLSSIDHQTTICVKASSIDSRLRKLVSKPFAHSGYELEPSTDKLRLKFSGAGLDLSLSGSSCTARANCDAFDIFVSDKSPEILITALEASNHSIGRVTSFMESASELSSRRRRYLVWATMNLLQGQTVTADPFATNLPSFLVQTGRPGRLRSDPSWKILTILHQCMRQMGPDKRRELQSNVLAPNLELPIKELTELSPLTQKRWAELYGQDEQGSHKVPAILQKLFPSKSENHSPLLFRGTLALSSRHTKFVLQSREGDYNEMKLSDFNLHLRCSTANYLPQHLPESIVADTEKSLHVIGAISARELDMSIYPSCVLFIRQVLFVQRQMTALGIDHEKPVQSNKPFTIPFRHVVLELALSASSLAFAAPAQQITFEAQTSGCTTSISSIITLPEAPSPPRGSLSVSFTADAILLQANQWKTNKASKSLLAGIELRHVVIHGAANEDTGSSTHARVLLSLDQFKINVPRSVLQLYRFIDSWRTEYLPAYDSMIQDLLLELDYNPRPRNPSPYSPALFSGDLKINVHAQMRELRTELHVMHGTWLTWSVLHSVTFLDLKGTQETEFGHRIGSQVIQLINGQPNIGRPTPNTNSVSLELPSLRLEGKYPQLDIRMHVDRFSVTLKPQYFDDFLAVQQKFGSDFNELVDLAIEFKTQRGTPLTEPSETIPTMFAKFDVSFTFDGFRIGIEGPSSTQYLDSSTIKGQVHSGTQKRWSFGVESLALSLAHQSAPRRARTNFDRKYRSAYMVFDMSAHNIEHLDSSQENHLGITINFVHAVMQPAAIAELGDLIDHIQAEMLSRQEQRAAELEEIRRKTRQVMRTLEHNDHPHSIRETKTFLDNRKIEFTVKDIGIVFPLTLQDDLMLPQMGSSIISPFSPSSVPALLISLSSVSFVTQRYETGQAKIQEFSFQFVPGFDQSQPGHFNGSTHDTRNRMIYPSMEAEVRSTSTPTTRQVRIRAIVSGFELDIEPSIVNYVFSIVDVYRQGRDRISRLATYTTRSDAASSITQLAPAVPSNAQYSAVLTTNIKASFEFKSGRIRTHTPSVRASDPERTQSVPTLSPQTEIFEHGTDILDLPMVSAWLEYKATPACQKVMGSTTPNQSILVCDTTIHPISNVLKPSLLPFLTDVSKRVQERLAHAPTPPRSPGATPFSDLSTIHEGVSLDDSPGGASVTGSMQVIFSLNINKSTLELTCQPDVNVVAGLNWESGGFVVTISPGAREVAVVGTMTSLTAGIQHGYLNEDSISAKAQNLTFSVDFRKLKSDEDATTNSVSVVINTEIAAKMRFSRLQDLLCFKAVWLDRIPVFDSLVRPPPVHSSVSVIKAELPGSNYVPLTQPFQTLVLVNVDKVNIMADLGPTIAQVTLDIESLTFRTRLCEDVSEATLTMAKLDLLSERAVMGYVRMPDFVFQTVRRRHGKLSHDIDGHAKMLELTLKSGDIEAAMEYERQHLMHFHADPLHVTIFDDWSKVDSNIPVQDREVLLEFGIQAGEILAYSSTSTIPKMISLGGKLAALIKAQKLGAARESNAFRTSQMPKPDTALSEVAAAMLQSARSKFRETETFQFAVIQRLKLSIKTLKLAVPPVTQQRAETALFTARQVEGELHRTIRPHEPPRRKLLLELGAFSIRGVPQQGGQDMQMTARDILDAFPYGSRVFLFPATRIIMQTKQTDNKICYDFAINLTHHPVGDKGIYVALSFASWNWLLGIKRKFETDLETAFAEVAQLTKDTTPRHRRRTVDTDPGGRSTDDDAGTRTAYHSPALTPRSQTPPPSSAPTSPHGASIPTPQSSANVISVQPISGSRGLEYEESESNVSIDAPTLEVLGRATPDISNTPTFKGLKKALPTWVHEYTTLPIEEIMNVLLEVYSKQLRSPRSDAIEGGY
ncbi:fermentation associated protein [Rhizoctonia solani]|uniref:Fermentation associated protein n=1 Tax=Rhizoctonia solani TaxID=456999 RepID=A0A8H7H8W9_9AGAM|nr:fermentation associated protein [Rhizoctonia solani]